MGKGPEGLMFTPRGTVGGWYTEDYTFDAADPGPSSSTYGAYLPSPSPLFGRREYRHSKNGSIIADDHFFPSRTFLS